LRFSPKENTLNAIANEAQLCSGLGSRHTNEPEKQNRKPYLGITLSDIQGLVDNPTSVKKENAQWIIPSTLKSRNFKKQRQEGKYWLLWLDLDKTPPPIEELKSHLTDIIGNCDFEIYNTSSATADNQKCRILIPLRQWLRCEDWTLCQEILNDKLTALNIEPDRANKRSGQLCYLPNKGKFYNSSSLRNGVPFDAVKHFEKEILAIGVRIEEETQRLDVLRQEAQEKRATLQYDGSKCGLINAFNETYTVAEILLRNGYPQRGLTFCHPNSTTGNYSASIDPETGRVHALSTKDPLYSENGARDAFSCFERLEHNDDRNAALIDAGDNYLAIGEESWNKVKQREYMSQTEGGLKGLKGQEASNDAASNGASKKATHENTPIQWQPPTTLIKSTLPTVTPLDSEIIPEPYRDWLIDISERMQSPIDFVSVSALTVTASIIGSGCGVRPKAFDDWEVIPNVWGACIGRPSVVLKSPSMGEVMRMLDKLQAEYGDIYDQEAKGAEFDSMMQEATLKDIKKDIEKTAKGKGGDKVIDGAQVAKLKADYMAMSEDNNEVTRRLFKTNETSIQSMTVLQKENSRGILTFRDELTALLVKWDREDHQDERAFFLEGWNGDGSYTDVKIGRGLTDAKNICISLLGGIQPDKLSRYLYQAQKGNNDGLIQRLQLAVYPDEPNNWENIDRYPDADAKNNVYAILSYLAKADFKELGAVQGEYDDRPYFRFNNEGQAVFNEWLTHLQTVKIKYEDDPLMTEHFGKYRSLMPSLSLIFHLIELVDGTANKGGISDSTARLAVKWCDYLETHARRIYGMKDSPEQDAAIRLSEKIKDKKLISPFTVRDVQRKAWHGLKDNSEIKEALIILIEENWIKEVEKQYSGSGRRPAPVYLINPVFL